MSSEPHYFLKIFLDYCQYSGSLSYKIVSYKKKSVYEIAKLKERENSIEVALTKVRVDRSLSEQIISCMMK